MSTFEIYNNFNELEFSKDSSLKDLFDDITKDVFGDFLQFAIIETTTIGNESGVGTTQYIACKDKPYIKNTVHKEYFDIIKTIKDNSELGSPSKYYDWYKRNEYYYAIGSNLVSTNLENNIKLRSEILDPHKKDWSAEQYLTDYDTKLTDEEIKKFLTQYINSLLEKDWFNELPHYFVLVKPISIKDETGLYIPLGNLYLKIGTNKQVELKEYKKYVSLLQAAWFNKFGGKILKEYSKKRISDLYKPKEIEHPNLKKKLSEDTLFTIKGNKIKISHFFEHTFDSGIYEELIQSHLISVDDTFIIDILKQNPEAVKKADYIENIRESFKDYTANDPINFIGKDKEGLVKFNQIETESIKHFLQLLSKRRFALIFLFIYEWRIEDIHTCLAYSQRASKQNSKRTFLRDNLFIYTKPITKKTLAHREKEFLNNVIDKIQCFHSTFKCEKFDLTI